MRSRLGSISKSLLANQFGVLLAVLIGLFGPMAAPDPAAAHLSIIRQGAESRGSREAGDDHGKALAAGDFNGDGFEDLAVGAPGEAVGSLDDAGAVVISWGTPLGLTHIGASILTEDDWGGAAADAEFGFALAAGDFNNDGRDDLAVGCPGSNLGLNIRDAGIVYLYSGQPSGLTPWHDLSQTDGGGAHEVGDRFGSSLCVGNFNGDNGPFADLAVGSPGEDSTAGAIFYFCGGIFGVITGPSGWIKQSTLGGTNDSGDLFGFSLAAGQVAGLSYEDLLVGAPGKDAGGIGNSGQAYLILGGSNGLTSTHVPIDATTGDLGSSYQTNGNFGYAVAVGSFYSGNYDGVAIGEPGRTVSSQSRAGRVCVGKGTAGGVDFIGPEAIVLTEASANQTVAANEEFGRALTAGPFETLDSYDDLVVGTPYDDPSGITNAGLVLVFFGSANGPIGNAWAGFYQGTLNDSSEPGDLLGYALTVGKFDDTGKGAVVAGAPGEDSGIGMVHVIAPWRQRYNIGAKTSIALDCEGNYVFTAKPFDEVCIASTTKSMTLLLACERSQLPPNDPDFVDLDETYEVKSWIRQNVGGSTYDFENRETLTLRDLLYALMFPSGNDASYAIADMLTGADNNWNNGYAGTCQDFVDEMNARAAQLGMNGSFFTNPAGLDVGDHHSTAADMMKLARAVLNNPLAAEVVRTNSYTIISDYWDDDQWRTNYRSLGYGFLANLQNRNPDFVGIKPGRTPCAQGTGVFAAREPGEGIAVAGTFGTDTSESWGPYYDTAASLMQVALAECDYDFVFLPDMPLFRFDVENLSTLVGSLTGGSIAFERSALELPAVQYEIMRSTSGAPTSAEVDLIRNSETFFSGGERLDFGIAPFEGHGEIAFVNQGETNARFRVYLSYQTGYAEFNLAPGGRAVLPAHAQSMGRLILGIENRSGDAASIPMLLSVREEYSFDLTNIPGAAGRVFSAEIARVGDIQQDGTTLRVRGTDPNGGPILHAIAHEEGLTVDAPEFVADAASGPRVTMRPAAPNPFTGETRLAFELRSAGAVALTIHDAQGRRVRGYAQAQVDPGAWAVVWDGRSDDGARCAAGIYFYRLEVDGRQEAEGRVIRVE